MPAPPAGLTFSPPLACVPARELVRIAGKLKSQATEDSSPNIPHVGPMGFVARVLQWPNACPSTPASSTAHLQTAISAAEILRLRRWRTVSRKHGQPIRMQKTCGRPCPQHEFTTRNWSGHGSLPFGIPVAATASLSHSQLPAWYSRVIGRRKTLWIYGGRPPNGRTCERPPLLSRTAGIPPPQRRARGVAIVVGNP